MLTVRDVDYNGASVQGDRCLNIEVSLTPGDPIMLNTAKGQQRAELTWLTMGAQIWTTQLPRRQLGRVVVEPEAMPGLNGAHRPPSPWHWVVGAEDVELVEQLRTVQPDSPLQLSVEVEVAIQQASAA